MIKHIWVSFDHSRSEWLEVLRKEYLQKISGYTKIDAETIRVKSRDQASAGDKKEFTRALAKNIAPADLVVTFDQRGKSYNSEEFAQKVLTPIRESGKQKCFWIVGPAFGLHQDILNRANFKVVLAPFIMNHQIAEAVALEQLYRAHTILAGHPYHNP